MTMGQSNFAEKNDITQRAVTGRNKTEDTKGKDVILRVKTESIKGKRAACLNKGIWHNLIVIMP